MITNTLPFANEIALQQSLRPALTPVGSNVDYHRSKSELEEMDRLLTASGVESMAVELALEGKEGLSAKRTEKLARFAIQSIRAETLRWYLGGVSFRALSKAICSCDLYARFCGVIDLLRSSPWRCPQALNRSLLSTNAIENAFLNPRPN